MSDSKLLSSDLEDRIIQFLDPYSNLFAVWTAGLLASCEAPDQQLMLKIKDPNSTLQNRGEISFLIKISKKLSASEIKDLVIISWFLPEDVRKMIQLGVLEESKKRRFIEQIDLQIYLKDKIHCLLFLQQQSVTYDALFGRLGNIVRLIKLEVEAFPTNYSEKIFSRPFWRNTPWDIKNEYSGWSRHHKDAGSLRPNDGTYLKEESIDRLIQDDYEQKRKKFEKDLWSTTELIIGFII